MEILITSIAVVLWYPAIYGAVDTIKGECGTPAYRWYHVVNTITGIGGAILGTLILYRGLAVGV